MLEHIPLALVNGLGLLGGIVFIFYMVATGRSGTPREMRDKNEEIRWLRETTERQADTNAKQAETIATLLAQQSNVVQLMAALRQAADIKGESP